MSRTTKARSVKQQTQRFMRDFRKYTRVMVPRAIERSLTSGVVVVAAKAMEYTPIEYGLLQNSQFYFVRATPSGYAATIGYTAGYAAALHNRDDWSARPPGMKQGPAWNPESGPNFLGRAVTETRDTVIRIMLQDLRI